jgi:hypothetical protein
MKKPRTRREMRPATTTMAKGFWGSIRSTKGRVERNPLKLKDWLGGLDSNQDSQIQNLKSCQLDDLPTVVKKRLNAISFGEKEAFSLSFHRWTPDYLRQALLSALSALLPQHPRCQRYDSDRKHLASCGQRFS